MKQEEIESTELNLNNLIDESEFLENPIGIKSPVENGKHYELFEIFNSVEGEFPKSGEFVTFVRFPICNYSCSWCDTMKNPENKPLWFKYEDIKKSVIMSEALTFTGGEASLFLSDMVDIINRLIKCSTFNKSTCCHCFVDICAV